MCYAIVLEPCVGRLLCHNTYSVYENVRTILFPSQLFWLVNLMPKKCVFLSIMNILMHLNQLLVQ